MRQDRYAGIVGAGFITAIVATIYGYTAISGDITTHFTATGQPEGTMAKFPGLLLIPGIMAGIYAFFQTLPRIDPLKENYDLFNKAYRGMMAAIIGFLAYTQIVLVGWNAGFEFNMIQAIAPAVAALFIVTGTVLERAEQNWFIGIRTPWTLSSEEVWTRTHKQVAPLFKVGGALVVSTILFPEHAATIIGGIAATLAAFSVVYSYVIYRKVG